jgi:hypothetical protein
VARVLAIVVLVTAHAHVAHADGCPPAVALTGDDAAVRAVREQLDARGIADETPSCPVLRARIEQRGSFLVLAIDRVPGRSGGVRGGSSNDARDSAQDGASGAARGAAGRGPRAADGVRDAVPDGVPEGVIERAVRGPSTAAMVIESWLRSDVAAPLLEARVVPPAEAEPPAAAAPGMVAPAPATTGTQLFLAAETSVASDRTVWQGMQLGACVMLGPICAAARVHGGKVISAPDGWNSFVRKGAEVYGGIDIPIAIGRSRLTPGFAAGYGTMLTHHIGDGEKTGIEISGPRAEAHVGLSIPVTSHLAIDLATTAELTQATGMETHGTPSGTGAAIVYPDEPRALFRFAVGVRYGVL